MSEPIDWVALSYRSTPGWPWPDASWGLDPMYGADGWCRGCGTPNVRQLGHLTLRGGGFPRAAVFVPNWHFDALCVDAATAAKIAAAFSVEMRAVYTPRSQDTGVQQLLPVVTESSWYDGEVLRRAVVERHREHNGESSGETCEQCRRWRWLPVPPWEARPQRSALTAATDVIASPERFGSGMSSFQQLLVRRALGELLASSSPRTISTREIVPLPD